MDKREAIALYRSGLRRTVKTLLTFSRRVRRLQKRVERLQERLAEVQRAAKRQAAPFSKGAPKVHPKTPGRRAGHAYGPKAYRPIPEEIDEVLQAPFPDACPKCGGPVEPEETLCQYQTDLPEIPKAHVTQFTIPVGRCGRCGARVQGRHPRQTSNATGAAASQVGPRALALAAQLNKGLGLPFGKVQTVLTHFQITVTRGGLCLGLHRLARLSEPTYRVMIEVVRHSPVVSPDETGWRINGLSAWLHGFVTELVTVYTIRFGRGFEEASEILTPEFAGVLERDGWAPYRQFLLALHQSCLVHLDRRCDRRLESAIAGAAGFPHRVQNLIHDALDLRDRRDQGLLSPPGLAIAIGRLESRLHHLLQGRLSDPQNRTFAKHLRNEQNAVFTFLKYPGIQATNWRAEHAMRPAVVTRKVCGGNRSPRGAHTQEVLTSVLRTAWQQRRHPFDIFVPLLRSPLPRLANLWLPGFSP